MERAIQLTYIASSQEDEVGDKDEQQEKVKLEMEEVRASRKQSYRLRSAFGVWIVLVSQKYPSKNQEYQRWKIFETDESDNK